MSFENERKKHETKEDSSKIEDNMKKMQKNYERNEVRFRKEHYENKTSNIKINSTIWEEENKG